MAKSAVWAFYVYKNNEKVGLETHRSKVKANWHVKYWEARGYRAGKMFKQNWG